MHSPQDHFIITLSLATDVTDATLGASGLWLGTRTGAGGTTTLTVSFFGRSPWLYGQQVFSYMEKALRSIEGEGTKVLDSH